MSGLRRCLKSFPSPVTLGVWPMFGLFRHLDISHFRSSKMAAKPPNIVVYTEGVPQRITEALSAALSADRYVFLGLDERRMTSEPWQDNVQLLVFNDSRTFSGPVRRALSQYWTGGGKVLVIGSGSGSCLEAIGAATKPPARDDRRKSGVRVGHRAHGVVTFDLGTEVLDVESGPEPIAEEVNTEAVVIGAVRARDSDGLLVFSQVPLDAGSDIGSEASAWARLVLRDILRDYFGLECATSDPCRPLTVGPCYVITSGQSSTEDFLRAWQRMVGGDRLECPKVALRLFGRDVGQDDFQDLGQDGGQGARPEVALVLGQATGSPPTFRAEAYFGHLKTRALGRWVWYGEVLTSTMDPLDSPNVPPGVVCVAGRQTGGRGRGGHVWLSPEGCAMFSLQIRVPLNSDLGRRMPFVQHLASLAIVEGITGISGYENLDLRLKWPNDIYHGSRVKLGGVIVQSTIIGNEVLCTVGCGLNVSNAKPTLCLDDVIRAQDPPLPVLGREVVIASALNRMEEFVSAFQQGRSDHVLRSYYARWLHSNVSVRLTTPDGSVRPATVRGLDEFGFLEVDVEGSGRRVSVQPDGNSFDMLHHLVIVRS